MQKQYMNQQPTPKALNSTKSKGFKDSAEAYRLKTIEMIKDSCEVKIIDDFKDSSFRKKVIDYSEQDKYSIQSKIV